MTNKTQQALSLEDRRNEFAQRVFHQLAADRRELAVVDSAGVKPVVVALESELLSVVVARVAEAGGQANTFVELKHGQTALLSVRIGAPASNKADDLGHTIHKDSTIGMVVAYVTMPDKEHGIVFRIDLPHVDAADMEYVEKGELVEA